MRYTDEYNRFSKAAGLRTQQERLYQHGFGPKQAKAADKGYAQRVAEVGESAAAQNWHTIPVAGGRTDTKYRMIRRSESGDTDTANTIINENVKNTNPAYNSGNPAYRQNCQRCVVAYEMRRRGYDVIAKPAFVDANGNLSKKDELYAKWPRIFKDARLYQCSGLDGGKAAVIERMKNWGNGSVAEIQILWDASRAHVFVAENVDGNIRFIDPQTGDVDCSVYFTKTIGYGTIISRIDNLEVTDLVEKCIKNRGGKL